MTDGKPTNPKDALGVKKAPLHLVPTAPLYELGLAMLEGGRRYGAHNYRAVGTRASVYYDAAMRHLADWWEGEDIDPDSGLHHLIKAAACIFVMRDSIIMGNHVDDRPIKYPDGLGITNFNKQTAAIIEKYPDCVAPFLEKDKKFVCSVGWDIILYELGPARTGWYIINYNLQQNLHKNLTLHDNTGIGSYNFGEAPGYWATKEEAEVALAAYLEKERL